jgi:hypothetical protein
MGWHAYCLSLLDRSLLGNARMLVIRRDSDWLENDLARRSVVQRCDVLRVAASRTRSKLATQNRDNITYLDADPNEIRLPAALYDAVWSDDALGRIKNLDHLIEQIAQSLQPNGHLFAYDYVGPDRMALSPAQRKAVHATYALIPKRYRQAASAPGRTLDHVELPPAGGITSRDAPRNSSNVIRLLRKHLQLTQSKPLGGTLLQFVLRDIAANFQGDDSSARAVLEMLFAVEDTLIDSGELESDFALIVGKRR